ncbi:hypothetical protein EGH55_01445 [Klebsiella aerogenes]|nr:hypothetical protein EGH55_01445 [Klebsiella aerogenes]
MASETVRYPGYQTAQCCLRRMAAAPYPAYGPCHCEFKISILYPWLLKLSVTRATKPHSVVCAGWRLRLIRPTVRAIVSLRSLFCTYGF